MAEQPLISVLMPLYNDAKYVGMAIESILKQTYQNWELLIVNDGSTDVSKDIVLGFKDKRIHYFENEENKGIVYTRNRLLSLSKGGFLANLDSDDIAYSQRLEIQMKFLVNHREYDVCGSWAYKISEGEQRIGRLQPPVSSEDIHINMLFQFPFVHSTLMIRKSSLNNHKYNVEFPVAEDYDFVQRWKPKAYNLPQYLVGYRWHSSNISKEKALLMSQKRDAIIRRQLEEFEGNFDEKDIQNLVLIGNLLKADEKGQKYLRQDLNKTLQKLITYNKEQKVFGGYRFLAFLWYRWIFYFASQKCWLNCLLFGRTSFNPIVLRYLLPLLYRKAVR